jgi:hypothetical protein
MTTTVTRYSIREGFHLSQRDANVIGPELERIGQGREFSEIPAKEIVKEGSKKGSPLRAYLLFDKSDKELAHQTRLERARYLCRALQVRIEVVGRTKPVPVRAFVTLSSGKPGKSVYGAIQKVAKSQDRRREVLAEARESMQQWVNRYETMLEVMGILSRARELVDVLTAELENEQKK